MPPIWRSQNLISIYFIWVMLTILQQLA